MEKMLTRYKAYLLGSSTRCGTVRELVQAIHKQAAQNDLEILEPVASAGGAHQGGSRVFVGLFRLGALARSRSAHSRDSFGLVAQKMWTDRALS